MRTQSTQKGFTLVELAIVMTIIGLLIGGILKGQELMQNARVTSTIAQVRAYEAATTTFRDKYDSVPGDMANASVRIPNCGTACNAGSTQAGNGLVGDIAWAGAAGSNAAAFDTQATAPLASITTAASAAVGFETNLYWTHLLLSDLIAGVTNASVNGGTLAWGETHPSAKIGGGFVVGYGNGVPTPGSGGAANTGPSGMVLALVQAPNSGGAANLSASGSQPLTATRAAQIDRKMDDGRSNSGFVQAYGATTTCFTAAGQGTYVESVTSNDCGLMFRIQG